MPKHAKTCHRNVHACQCTKLSRFVKNSVHAKVSSVARESLRANKRSPTFHSPSSARAPSVARGFAAFVADSVRGEVEPATPTGNDEADGASVLRVGIPWDPIEFISKAGKLDQLSKNNKPLT